MTRDVRFVHGLEVEVLPDPYKLTSANSPARSKYRRYLAPNFTPEIATNLLEDRRREPLWRYRLCSFLMIQNVRSAAS
jgi:hypothetical protein